jgi:two-component system OmpR family response regulator
MKILLVEDDEQTRTYVCNGLSQSGHTVDAATNGSDAWELFATREYDIVVVDRMLPDLDGIELVRNIRQTGSTSGILMLTAVGRTDARIDGLASGADDYLIKPFAFAEFLARVNSVSRRVRESPTKLQLNLADLELDISMHVARRSGSVIELHNREFQLLEYFLRNVGRVVTRSMLLERVWDIRFEPRANIVDTHVSRLRAKIDGPSDTKLIHTVRGIGYRMSLDA